jgi:signal transduction histidine kinase
VNVEEVIDSVLSIYDKRVKAKGIQVTRRYRLDGTTIKTYPAEIRQVFSTLLLNAMEAVHAGGTVDVRARKATHWQNSAIHGVRVTISDNGVGISATNISRIFEPFLPPKERMAQG